MLSVLNGHTDCVYSLLNKGANVDAKDKWGRTALHRGVGESSVAILSSPPFLPKEKHLPAFTWSKENYRNFVANVTCRHHLPCFAPSLKLNDRLMLYILMRKFLHWISGACS